MKILYNYFLLFIVLIFGYGCNQDNKANKINSDQLQSKSDSIYSLMADYKTDYYHLKYKTHISEATNKLREGIDNAEKTKNFKSLKKIIKSPYLINEISALELSNIEKNPHEENLNLYRLRIIELVCLEKALDVFKYPYRFEEVASVVFEHEKELYVFTTGISNREFLKGITVYTDSTLREKAKIDVKNEGNYYKIKTPLQNVYGHVDIENEYLKSTKQFFYER